MVGQPVPVVSVTVTQVGDPEVDVVDPQRTRVGEVPTTATREANVEDRIFENSMWDKVETLQAELKTR